MKVMIAANASHLGITRLAGLSLFSGRGCRTSAGEAPRASTAKAKLPVSLSSRPAASRQTTV
jgi:hypothetical protein